jgi:hypothetical protein
MSPEFFLTNTRVGFASFDRVRKRAAVLTPGLETSLGGIESSKGEMV